MSKKNLSAERIVKAILDNPDLLSEVIAGLVLATNIQQEASESAIESVNWYDAFESEFTTITVKDNVVTVKVARGHANEFRPQLRAAGFRWGRKCHAYWAWLDDEKRAEVARRNAENDALTEGMTYEQRKAFWAERKARKSA